MLEGESNLDFQTIVIIFLIVVIDVIAFLEYYSYKIRLDEARKKVSVKEQSQQPIQTPVQRIRQTIQTPLVVVDNGSQKSSGPVVNSEVERLKSDNAVLEKKTDMASLKARNSIQTSLNEVGSKIDNVLSQVQSVKGKMNSNQTV